jgi:hypothetical protein
MTSRPPLQAQSSGKGREARHSDGRQDGRHKWDGGKGLDHGQSLEVNGRQEVEVDGEQDVEQDVHGGQEMNGRQRRVGDEYAMGGIHLQTLLPPPDLAAAYRAPCHIQSFLLPPQQP